MKAKLVKYPFNEKKYRWDTWYQGKEFEYFWDESLPNNFDTIEPYFKLKDSTDVSSIGYIDLKKNATDIAYKDRTISVSGDFRCNDKNYYIVKKDLSNYVKRYGYFGWGTNGKIYHYSSDDEVRSIVQYRYSKKSSTGALKMEIICSDTVSDNKYIAPNLLYWENYTNKDFQTDTDAHALELAKQIASDIGLTYNSITVNVLGLEDEHIFIIERDTKPTGLTDKNPRTNVNIRGTTKRITWEIHKGYKFNLDFDYCRILTNVLKYPRVTLDILHRAGLPVQLYTYIYQNDNADTNGYLIKHMVNNGYFDSLISYGAYQGHNINIYNFVNYLSVERVSGGNSATIYVSFKPEQVTQYEPYEYWGLGIAQTFAGNGWSIPSSGVPAPDYTHQTRDKFGGAFSYNHYYPKYNDTFIYDNDTWNVRPYVERFDSKTDYIFNLKDTIYVPECLIQDITQVYFVVYDEVNHPNDAYYYYDQVGVHFRLNNVSNRTSRIAVDVDEWKQLSNAEYINFELVYSSRPNYLYTPYIHFLGDETADEVTLVEGQTSVLDYTLGEGVSGEFVPKTLQYYAPCEYSGNIVSSRTWLTYNTYTDQEWNNDFHFCGSLWNNIGSPFAYLNGIHSSSGNRAMVYTYDVAEAGTYKNVFSLINGGFEVKDSLNNSYIATSDSLLTYRHYYDDNVGSLWYFGSGTVSSTDRHAYPDAGSQDGFAYRLRPQDTKFLRYYRTRDELNNVELISDRYHYTHDTVDFCDRSYEGTVCGTSTSTGEDNIPNGTWREYLGLYLGTSIPFLGIVETEIPPSEILGVPQYDKQVNTSDTLKYGTVASASLTFTLNKPVGETLTHNNELLILYYDFKHRDEWERLGFFRVDSIEALDENTTSLMAHDEVYKLNKYVDDFLEAYTQTTTLDLFYRDLLNYCDCFYDTHQDIIHNGTLGMTNVYHAVKTTGVQVAHYVANLSPGFIHANIDGDIVLQQYQLKDDNLTIADYTNLVYTAYDTDMLDKVKIVSSNAVKGQSAGGSNKVYFLADNPLLSELQATSYFNNLAESILDIYNDIPTYRPATVNFLIIPRELKIGDIVNLTTPKNETYKVIVMAMTISSSGVQIKSFGTQSFPVEAESNSEFVNLINDMGEISGDVSNMMEAQRTMATEIANNREAIGENATEIEAIKTKNAQQDTSIGNNASAISALQTLTNGFGVSVESNLATIALNGSTSNVAMKGYVDSGDSSTLASAKRYADGLVGTSVGMKYGTFRWGTSTSTTATNSVHCMYIGTNDKRNGIFIPTAFVANDNNRTYLFRVYNGSYYKLYDDDPSGGDVGWFAIGSVSFTED